MKPRRPPTLNPPPEPREASAPPLTAPRRAATAAAPAQPLPPDPPLPTPRLRRPLRLVPLLIVALLWLLGLLVAVVLALRWLPPPTTAFMLQSPVKPVQYRWVPAERISDAMRHAVVASEDQKFYEHRGFDFEAIGDALDEHRRRGRLRGASTISQQTAKNLFLWPGGSFVRKGIEAVFTVLIETLWNKPRILEVYLNIAEFGPGIYGVEAAAQAFFGRSAAALTPEQAARLAAVLPNPRRWSAAEPGPYVQRRVEWILGQMGYGRRAEDPTTAPTDEAAAAATAIESAPPGAAVQTRALEDVDAGVGAPRPIPADEATSDPTTAAPCTEECDDS
ncbi:monofunctional biosynthetic peptidoglycan transglycosylase [Sinimarinibacterium thermocellulolyticum]|uniref:Biosynthetic peptidoglycan transglycosylase n=1 Tax=Sinimarinibacterium thermocellulolyticum TaxID=3170016 RepID=A0ABV2AEE9_9GAMM